MFRWEEDLRKSFLEHANPSLWTRPGAFDSHRVLKETEWSSGRADAVWAGILGKIDDPATLQVLRQPVASRVVAALRRQSPRTETSLLKASGVMRATFRPVLARLIDVELVAEHGQASFVLGSAFPEWTMELCAFEFKLTNWRRAFYQALRYRAYAHRVYIVMPPSSVGPALEHEDRFHKFGIGLIEHDDRGRSETLVRVRKGEPHSRSSYVRAMADVAAAAA